ncbi:Glyoxalase/Bleomycin resistance protein/Dihydroxybiphenyl dioxygenase [Corynebacterium ramonii]|uniref:Glyoxalase/Bleomycin resistance protein/Dihydroxybiphenyl dioxygenase n=2 Tax=Corynebacteriaceae TaxID=1653 RepID=A0ABN4EHF7_9CORY|nr:Glyoxalase/Bleomycin resistance protein/Dihydroxybiphenyl dioxygenase [Corynebacterium ramonii FRC0011]ESU58492.1 glyoxalase [Corynebacterium ulcerans NCTC 12077]
MIAHMIADVTPYRHFRGQAKEALEFYRDVFDLDLTLMTYGESGFADQAGGSEWSNDWIMHGELRDAGRKVLFGADVPPERELVAGDDTVIALTGGVDARTEIEAQWEALSQGAEIHMPLETAPWGASFGQLRDRFGTLWMFNIEG